VLSLLLGRVQLEHFFGRQAGGAVFDGHSNPRMLLIADNNSVRLEAFDARTFIACLCVARQSRTRLIEAEFSERGGGSAKPKQLQAQAGLFLGYRFACVADVQERSGRRGFDGSEKIGVHAATLM
jgi:hypothetical protein